MGNKITFNDLSALKLAGIGGGAAINAYLGKREAEKYNLTPEEKKKLMIRRGLKGAALGALGTGLVSSPIISSRVNEAVNSGSPVSSNTFNKISDIAGISSVIGGIGANFYGRDVRKKINKLKKEEVKAQSNLKLFADGGGLAGFGAKALNWWNKRSDAQKGAIIGGVAGAGIGAARKGVKGALVGAGVGAGAGALGGMAYKKWGNGALKNTFGGDSTSSTNTTRPTRTSTSPSTGSNHNRTTAVNFDPRTKTHSALGNYLNPVVKGDLSTGMKYAPLIGAGIGAVGGGLAGYVGTKDKSKKKKNAVLAALAGAGLGYGTGSIIQGNRISKDIKKLDLEDQRPLNKILRGRTIAQLGIGGSGVAAAALMNRKKNKQRLNQE